MVEAAASEAAQWMLDNRSLALPARVFRLKDVLDAMPKWLQRMPGARKATVEALRDHFKAKQWPVPIRPDGRNGDQFVPWLHRTLLGQILKPATCARCTRRIAPRRRKPPRRRIGALMPGDENDPVYEPRVSASTQALADLGWTDGRNVRMDLQPITLFPLSPLARELGDPFGGCRKCDGNPERRGHSDYTEDGNHQQLLDEDIVPPAVFNRKLWPHQHGR